MPCLRQPFSPAACAMRLLWVPFVTFALFLSGCGVARELRCASAERLSVSELLYFGTARPGGTVSSVEWSVFLAGAVTPRFPSGLTAWSAAGQWQSADGTITRENSFVLNLVHPGTEAAEQSVNAVIAEYKARFQQEAVLRVRTHACTSF